MRPGRDQYGRLIGTTLAQDFFERFLLLALLPVLLVSLLLYPPAKRVGSDSSWT